MVENAKKLTGGAWRTIHGVHVYIKGGKIVAGPKEMKGKSPDAVSAPKQKEKKEKGSAPPSSPKPSQPEASKTPSSGGELKNSKKKVLEEAQKRFDQIQGVHDKTRNADNTLQLNPKTGEIIGATPAADKWRKDAVTEGMVGKEAAQHLSDYVKKDKRPEGAIKEALDKAVSVSAPLAEDRISYRGMRLTKAQAGMLREGATITYNNPSSHALTEQFAKEFSKEKGFRKGRGEVGVLVRTLIPKGTKVARMENFGYAGSEHVLPSNTKIKVVAVKITKTLTTIYAEVQ